jgi:hypothetical protein
LLQQYEEDLRWEKEAKHRIEAAKFSETQTVEQLEVKVSELEGALGEEQAIRTQVENDL